jgi:hypothetical protein
METIKEKIFLYGDAIYGNPFSLKSLNQYTKFYRDGSIGIVIDIDWMLRNND